MYQWQFESPFTTQWNIQAEHIDHYNHVNNVAYIAQLERTAWAHSNSLGLTIDDYRLLDKAMVIQSHSLFYRAPCKLNDRITCATWIVECYKSMTLTRKFQYICNTRNKVVFEAQTVFVCITLSSGHVSRMPERFKDVYGAACIGESL